MRIGDLFGCVVASRGWVPFWDLLNSLLKDDPGHHALAFCLIWWIPLLLTPLAWWILSRTWSNLTRPGKWMLAAGLTCPLLLTAMQLTTKWYLAGYWAPLIVYPTAVAGYACLLCLAWLSTRRWILRGICVLLLAPVLAIAYMSSSSFILFMGMFAFPHASGRLTPRITWRTDWTSMSFTSD